MGGASGTGGSGCGVNKGQRRREASWRRGRRAGSWHRPQPQPDLCTPCSGPGASAPPARDPRPGGERPSPPRVVWRTRAQAATERPSHRAFGRRRLSSRRRASSSFSFVFSPSAGAGIAGKAKRCLKMADGYEDLREDELPGPAYEGYESAELACPAERSGHVAVGDGRHMFVWGGYKVSGWPGRGGRCPAVTRSGVGAPERPPRAPPALPTLRLRALVPFFCECGNLPTDVPIRT